MRFEWDEAKNKTNIRKHGLGFADAPRIFEGPMLVRLDTRREYNEDRWIGIGLIYGRVVVVVYTERENGEVIRIISVRKALRYERELFKKAIWN